MRWIEALLDQTPIARTVMLMRHAERPDIVDATQAETTMLTANGVESAKQFGAMLLAKKAIPHQVFHSTVPRCQQTADAIIIGLSAGIMVENRGPHSQLAAPYLPDPQRTYQYLHKRGLSTLAFIQHWFKGELDAQWVDDSRQSAQRQLAFLQTEWQRKPGFCLHVSHDWNILLFLWTVLGIEPTQESWPGFLEGILMTFDQDNITFRYRREQRTYPAAMLLTDLLCYH